MTKKYNLCYDVLTILACLMVVFFHCNGGLGDCENTISWKINVIERCIVYSAIPIFFMLTGAKLMEYRKRYSTKEYIKKRLLRVGVPFLFWNVFYVIYNLVFSPGKVSDSAKGFISQFINSDFQPRFWFFIPLFMVYMAIPVISLVLKTPNHRKYLWYTVGLAFALRWVLMPVLGILGIEYNSHIQMPVCSGYMIYVLFGYLVSTQELRADFRILLYISALFAGVFTGVYIINTSLETGVLNSYLFSYDFFPSGLTGAAIFVFVKQLFNKSDKLSNPSRSSKSVKFIRTVSSACMGVWLTHSLGIVLIQAVTGLEKSSYICRFVFPPIIFVVCVAGVLVIKKIPLLKHIV